MRGRGRGRGGGRTGMRPDDGGIIRRGPILTEPKRYPYNSRLCSPHEPLTRSEQPLVAFNRILCNFWRLADFNCRVIEKKIKPAVVTVPVKLELSHKEQKEAIVAQTTQDYFPSELMQDHYKPPTKLGLPIPRRRVAQAVTAVSSDEGGDKSGGEEEEAAAEAEEFGDEDYAHDHYADEDREEIEDGDDNDHF